MGIKRVMGERMKKKRKKKVMQKSEHCLKKKSEKREKVKGRMRYDKF
jgi:hypothetical protein